MRSADRRVNLVGEDETIAAIITPPGQGGIAALRIAGSKSLSLLKKHFRPHKKNGKPKPFVMRYGCFLDAAGGIVDEITAVYMPRYRSYTGLLQVELFCHGGLHVVRTILQNLLASGARAAEPGEFTKLAFLNGRIDLARAEAVAEIVCANTEQSYRAAKEHLLGAYTEHVGVIRSKMIDLLAELEASIDYPEEDLDLLDSGKLLNELGSVINDIICLADTYKGGRIIREGYRVAICGRPNAGKSSLFNSLLRQQRALVTSTAGTTRDYLSEWIELEGFAVNLIDTAGLRQPSGSIEGAGQKTTRHIISRADLVIWMVDIANRGWKAYLERDLRKLPVNKSLIVANKTDLLSRIPDNLTKEEGPPMWPLSCLTGKGIKVLKKQLANHIRRQISDQTDGITVTSARHYQKLLRAKRALKSVEKKLKLGESSELVAFNLREGIVALDEITGRVYTDQVLERIFSKFCIGK